MTINSNSDDSVTFVTPEASAAMKSKHSLGDHVFDRIVLVDSVVGDPNILLGNPRSLRPK